MTRDEAIDHLISIALMWAENAEEAFPRRLVSTDTDEELRELVENDEDEFEDAKQVRDTLLAAELLTKEIDT